jgi:hypothetical protein
MKSIIIFLCFAVFSVEAPAVTNSGPFGSPTTTGPFVITMLGAGWYAQQMTIIPGITTINPGSCDNPSQYILDPSIAGYSEYKANLMIGYAAGRPTLVALDGCYGGFPRIIGVQLY